MSRPAFLTRQFHDTPPEFTAIQRQRHLYIDTAFEESVLSRVRGKTNKVYITLAYCYFKVSYQFYDSAFKKDLYYLGRKFQVNLESLDWNQYQRDTRNNHHQLILDFMGFRSFTDKTAQETIVEFVHRFARVQKKFKECFYQTANKLRQEKIEIPAYDQLRNLIESIYQDHEKELLAIIDAELDANHKALLDKLLVKKTQDGTPIHQYQVTLLKRFSHSLQPGKIAKNVEAHDVLQQLFEIAYPIVRKLDINNEAIRQYANSVYIKQVFQLTNRNANTRYLYLLAFITHQYFRLQDIFIETLIAAVTKSLNAAEKMAREYYYKIRNEQAANTLRLVERTESHADLLRFVEAIMLDCSLDDTEKVKRTIEILNKKNRVNKLQESIDQVKNDLASIKGEALLYQFLEEGSLKLQRQCSDILKRIQFNSEGSKKPLMHAIDHFKHKNGKLDTTSPRLFLNTNEAKYIHSEERFNVKLYKVMLFKHVRDAIKGDSLSMTYSYRYQSLEQYLITAQRWKQDKHPLLRQADMLQYQDFDSTVHELDLELHKQYQETNEHVLANMNSHVRVREEGGYVLTSQRNTSLEQTYDFDEEIELYPKKVYFTLQEVLHTVNKACGFINEFQHHSTRYLKERPNDSVFIAATMGLGCHFSTSQFAKLASKSINGTTLSTTVNQYMSVENARLACNSILRYVDKLPISQLFIDDDTLHTSSDGQKWTISNPSLNANYSFKYGGKDLVVSAYSFIDCRHLFFHSEVISGAAREAHYMIDGVLKNDVVKSDLHSTDTHGYSEMVFGLTYLLNIAFAPRIKNIHHQYLYSLRNKNIYANLSYPILPKKKASIKLVEKYWDDILRLAASIKLGEVTASQVFSRLNSYSRTDNPLYLALKEFGRIIKSHYILRYVDDLNLRSSVQKQLNKSENGNRLDRALAIGRSEYTQTTKEEQDLVESHKRLIKNAIVCWNDMYLSDLLIKTKDKTKKKALIDKIKSSSVVSWEHLVIHGSYDFSDEAFKRSYLFDFNKITDPNILKL